MCACVCVCVRVCVFVCVCKICGQGIIRAIIIRLEVCLCMCLFVCVCECVCVCKFDICGNGSIPFPENRRLEGVCL